MLDRLNPKNFDGNEDNTFHFYATPHLLLCPRRNLESIWCIPERPQSWQETKCSGWPVFLFSVVSPKQKSQIWLISAAVNDAKMNFSRITYFNSSKLLIGMKCVFLWLVGQYFFIIITSFIASFITLDLFGFRWVNCVRLYCFFIVLWMHMQALIR